MANLLVLLSYEARQYWHEPSDKYVEQMRMCLRSVKHHSGRLPDLLILCDEVRKRQIAGLPELHGFKLWWDVFQTGENMCVDMCRRYSVFQSLRKLRILDRYAKVLYSDTDSLFFKDIGVIFDAISENWLYVKPERKFDPSVLHPYFCIIGDTPIPNVPYLNSGHFGFRVSPSTERALQGLVEAVPALVPRTQFLDQPVFNSYLRAKHAAGPLLNFEALDPLIKLAGESGVSDPAVVHYIDWNKTARMRGDIDRLGPSIAAFCLLLESAPERVSHVRDVVGPRLEPAECYVVGAIDGKTSSGEHAKQFRDSPDPARLTVYQRCALATKASHLRVMESFLSTGLKHGLVLEDDAVPGAGFWERVNEVTASLPTDFDLAYLYIDDYFRRLNPVSPSDVVVPAYETYSLACYLVSREGARKMIELMRDEPAVEAVDVVLVRLVRQHKIKAFCAARTFVTNAGQPCQGSKEGMPSHIWNDREGVQK